MLPEKVEQFAESKVGKAVIVVAATVITQGAILAALPAGTAGAGIIAGAGAGFVGGFVGSGGKIEAGIIGWVNRLMRWGSGGRPE